MLAQAGKGQSGALLITGDPGIGKSRLLQHAAEVVGGGQIARVSGVESEEQLGFAGLHRLLLPYLDRLPRLPGPQEAALAGALGLDSAPTAEPFLVGLATLTLLAHIGTSAPPVLCLIDDAQWIDPESLATFGFVARRLQADGIAMIFAAREAEDLTALQGIPQRGLAGLATEPARRLLQSLVPGRLGERAAEQIILAAAGNPLALTEMARGLTADQLEGSAPLPDHLPLGKALADYFGRRLAALPPATQRFLTLIDIAAGDDRIGAAETWRAASRLKLTPDDLQPAVEAGLLHSGPELAFRHPLIRSAINAASSATARRRSHAAIAAITDALLEPDSHVWHRAAAATQPDEDLAAALEASAARAAARGAYSRQAVLLQRASDLTPERHTELTRRLAAARAVLMAGDAVAAMRLLDSVPDDIPDPVLRAHTALVRADVDLRLGQARRVAHALLQAAQGLDPVNQDLVLELALVAVGATLASSGATTGTSPAEVGRVLIALQPGRPSTPRELFLHGFAARAAGQFGDAIALFREAFEALASGPVEEATTPMGVLAVLAGWELWDERSSREAAERIEKFDREHGLLLPLRYTLFGLSNMDALAGRPADALNRWLEGTDNAAGIPIGGEREWSALLMHAWGGEEEHAREIAADILGHWAEILPAMGDAADNAMLVLESSLGRHADAIPYARRLFTHDPLGTNGRILTHIVEVACRGGDLDLAHKSMSRLEERATLSATPWALGCRSYGRALLAEGTAAQPHYEQALEHLADTAITTETARVRLAFGEWLRRQRRPADARRQLKVAYELFRTMGADRYAQRAAAEIRATGGRVRARDQQERLQLTPQQVRIASLAASGATNAEIATQVFLSPSTVDYHLGKVFRTVGVTSRRQLAQQLGPAVMRPVETPAIPLS